MPRAGSPSTDGATYSRISSTSPASSKRAVELGARFDVQLEDVALGERAHQRRKVDAPLRVGQRHALDASGHAGLRAARGHDERLPPASTRAVGGVCAVAIDDHAPRLARRLHRAHGERGSSCSTVPMPVRIAQARARQA